VSTLVGLRDRALIAVMTFAFARIGAVVAMRVEDYFPKGKRCAAPPISARAFGSAATRSAPRGSRPISKPAAHSKTRKQWRRTKARARRSSTIAPATKSR
jgi:hypothetical protein